MPALAPKAGPNPTPLGGKAANENFGEARHTEPAVLHGLEYLFPGDLPAFAGRCYLEATYSSTNASRAAGVGRLYLVTSVRPPPALAVLRLVSSPCVRLGSKSISVVAVKSIY